MAESDTNRATVAVLVGAGAAGVALSWVVAQHSLIGARWMFLALTAAWVVPWLVGSRAAVRVPVPLSVALVVLFAVLTRLAAASGTTPSVSNDLYRYAWDSHVQLAGIDPYRYPPDAPEVAHLRTATFWPAPAECRHLGMTAGCSVLNRPDVRTIYPAVAEGWFVIVHVLSPGRHGARPWQLAGGLVDDLTVVLLAVGLRDLRRDPRQVAWYALSPIPVIEFAGNGHVDGFALLLLVAAIAAVHRERPALAGVLIGMATMVKLYPAIALAACWRKGRWRLMLAAAATVVLTELPHVVVVGARILGYLPGYIKEEHYATGSRFLLLGLLGLPGRVEIALAVVCVAVAIVVVFRIGLEPAGGVAVLLTVVILVTTPVQPWYAVTLAGIGALAGAPWLMLASLAAEPYYAAVILDQRHQVGIGRLCYGMAALGIGLAFARARRPRARSKGQDRGDIRGAAAEEAAVARRPVPRGE